MGLLYDLLALTRPPPPLVSTRPKPLPADVTLRLYEPRDLRACLSLYARNEPGHFPPGFAGHFEKFLGSAYLKLVFCRDDVPVAIGGVGLVPASPRAHAWLVFGMVAPDCRGLGIGSALLIARLCAIPAPVRPLRVLMTSVPGAQSFYAQFGFRRGGRERFWLKRIGVDRFEARLDLAAWQRAHQQLHALGLDLKGARAMRVV